MGENMKFDIEEAKKAGVFVSAGRGQGKSNLVMCFADRLMKEGALIKAFDLSQVWLGSSLLHYQIIEEGKPIENVDNCVYDLSRLYPEKAKEIVCAIAKEDFERQVKTPKDQRKWRFHIYEECQMLLPQNRLRSKEAQEILRFVSVGRNFDLSFIAITQRPSLIDQSVISLSSQRYFGKIENELDREKIKPWIGKGFASKLSGLKRGQFVYNLGDHSEIVQARLFASASKPKPIYTPKPIHAPNLSPSPKTSEAKLGALITWIAWLSFMIWLMLR